VQEKTELLPRTIKKRALAKGLFLYKSDVRLMTVVMVSIPVVSIPMFTIIPHAITFIIPMVPVPVFCTFMQNRLSFCIAPVPAILVSVFCKMHIRFFFIHHYFITGIQVIIGIHRRKSGRKYPSAAVLINEPVFRYIVIAFNIGQVIILCMIVTCRAPARLAANVQA